MPEVTEDGLLITKEDFLDFIEQQVGFCPRQNRPHSFLDFEWQKETDREECVECSMTVDEEKWEVARSVEMFMFGKGWVLAKKDSEEEI